MDDRSTLLYVLDLIAWRGHPELQRPSLPELFERIPLDARDRWSRAVDTFRAQASGRDPTLDPGLLAVRDYLRGAISIDGIQDGDRALISALEDVLPSYQDTWWPVHRAAARAWVDSVVQVLPGLEVRTATAIATAMRGPWPDRPIDVFVVYYAPRTGGYATGEPVVTIAIADAVSWLSDGLEPLFHHAAHAFVLVKSLRVTIERAFGAAGRQAPDRLWHTILFLTVEEAVAAARAEAGLPPAIPLGQALPYYTRDADYQRDFRAADLYWRPFLRGVTELTDALRGLIHDY